MNDEELCYPMIHRLFNISQSMHQIPCYDEITKETRSENK